MGFRGNDIGNILNELNKMLYIEGSKTKKEQQDFVLRMKDKL